MQPLDDQLSRLLKSAADQPHHPSVPGALTPQMEDSVIRAWRWSLGRRVGWFDGVLGPGMALAGAAMAVAMAFNYQSLSDLGESSQTVEVERLISDSSTQLALLP